MLDDQSADQFYRGGDDGASERIAGQIARRRIDGDDAFVRGCVAQALVQGVDGQGAHLGLANISTRLSLIYGGRASIRVDADEPGWTRVTLEVPQITDLSQGDKSVIRE